MRLSSLLLAFILFGQLYAQDSGYIFPINPGERNYLAGTMGELRGNHFHGGLDIRTGGREGLPVHLIADGYVSRIKISSGGYGHALYVQHPDGNTSVYGHLQRFEDELEAFIRNKQYEEETYEIELFPEKGQFSYAQGDTIAYSGNTGSSSGPHLHFEIRDKNQRFLNPLDFGFTEVIDRMIPVAKRIAFISLDENARVNGAFGRYEFDLIYVGNEFVTRKPIELEGRVGIEILHYDFHDGSWARNGIPEVTATINEDTVFRQIKNSMSFGLNKHINVHINYPTYVYRRSKFNKLYLDDGNELDIYLKTQKGYIFDPEKKYEIKVYLRDNFDNISSIKTTVNSRKVVYKASPRFNSFDIESNYLHFLSSDTIAEVYMAYSKTPLAPYTYRNKKGHYYLWDLRRGLPDSVKSGSLKLNPEFQVAIPPKLNFEFFNTHFDIKSYRGSLFDTLYLRFEKSYDSTEYREIFSFQNIDIPFKNSVRVTLKPDYDYGENYSVFSVYGNRLGYVGGERDDLGNYTFRTRSLASYTIATDSIPPAIIPYSWNRNNLRIKIFDELSGIKSYRATLDGEFLLMRYDSKKDMLHAIPKNKNLPIQGEFTLEIEDFFGNKSNIKRKL